MSNAELMAEARLKWQEIQQAEPEVIESVQNEPPIQTVETNDFLGLNEDVTDDLHLDESDSITAFTEPSVADQLDPVGAFADQVASRLDLEMVDALGARIRELELETGALRRVAADAVLAAREAVAMSAFAPRFEQAQQARSGWKFWRR